MTAGVQKIIVLILGKDILFCHQLYNF